MVSILGADWAWGTPSEASLRDAGVRFVARYLCSDRYASKRITRAEADRHQAAGRSIVLVWEDTASRMLSGRDGGQADARAADAQCTAIGLPGCPVYMAADWDASEAQQTLINAYLDGTASIIGLDRTGLYSGFWPASRARAAGKARYFWGTRAWSGGNWGTCGWQPSIMQGGITHIGGVECDWDTAHADDFGQWPRPGQQPAPPPFPYPPNHYLGVESPSAYCHSGILGGPDQVNVRTWQQQMARRGWRITADGRFGPQSHEVTCHFQQEKGLVVDGRIGAASWTASFQAPIS